MKTLQKYVLRQILVVFLVCLVVFTFVLFIGNMLKIIELVSKGISLLAILRFLLYLVPFMLSYSIPMSILTAVLLSFAKLSAENEITAIRASGISLKHIFRPVLGCALILVIFCYTINDRLRPNTIFAGRKLLLQIGIQEPVVHIRSGRFNEVFPDHMVYVGEKKGRKLKRVVVYRFNGDNLSSVITAENGVISYKEEIKTKNYGAYLKLFNGTIVEMPQEGQVKGKFNRVQFGTYLIEFDIGTQAQDLSKLRKKEREMTNRELRNRIRHLQEKTLYRESKLMLPGIEAEISSMLTRVHNRWAISFSCLVFILIGIPLGIRVHRKETSIGTGLSLMLVASYYFLITLGEVFQENAAVRPWLLMWVPNLTLLIIGAILIYRLLQR